MSLVDQEEGETPCFIAIRAIERSRLFGRDGHDSTMWDQEIEILCFCHRKTMHTTVEDQCLRTGGRFAR